MDLMYKFNVYDEKQKMKVNNQRWLQSDGAIYNRRAINHSNLSILEGLATLIGSRLTKEPTASPVVKIRINEQCSS